MPTRHTLLVTALVALLVTTSGCTALTGGSNVDAERVLNQTQEGMSDVETVSFDGWFAMDSEQTDQPTNVTFSGVADVTAAEGRAQIDVQGQSMEMYVVNETMYMNVQGTWLKQDLANATAEAEAQPTMTPAPGQFMNATEVSFEGNTTIDGTDVYELAVDVDEDAITEALEGSGQSMAGMMSIEDVSYTLFVTQDDYRLKRLAGTMDMTVQGTDANADMQITLSGFNEPVTVDLPDAARNAESMN